MPPTPRRRLRDRVLGRVIDVATAPVRRFALPRFGVTPLAFSSADGTALHADVYTPRSLVATRGTVILAHGYRDGRRQLSFLARPLLARGHRVIALDFRAHGRSEGTRVTIGAREADDVRGVIAAARALEGEAGRVAFLGFSMGASAYLLSGVEADVAVLDSPYDTLEEAMSARVRRYGLPSRVTSALLREGERRVGIDITRVRPIDHVAGLTRPTLFVFALDDPWIGATTRDAFARELPACASLRVVPGRHQFHFRRAWRSSVLSFLVDDDRALHPRTSGA